MKKVVPVELLSQIVNALATMTGLSYVQVQTLIDEINKCEVYEVKKK
jgi:hypothetical protein